ncbi:hypothetical protein A3H80_02370 [Candidatus Roizmanbacteria bacterium RIFCSPLOWO2_02_FULL_37_19]|uniref:Metallo-beta-lactamase domain-containing protein n=1 Tax=Candidatus Roizmanbacteria bacterium RIFCSPHIGHO2_02_FULL_37_24 TaxID=1802037 RepID=A0A1F7H1I2_9BACT|nr:MAG: hypothetical protein A2862_02990 [Candidatus Roizmanbacteria bacterium RIFCSPHIGHO2_01_FULL_38_41]OGK24716.1 MAG: hypothetical protein A3C24_01170 [Candidatus Roizmanbacteria bacterium RIFCSPHIGHO2_02_FULL_37_24]OGK32892.1 MAG: hypothetical protein A3E10_02915 [Candidatus Roizmanbacteria bacterium RIFCSPHIGHO2_12_FULL_37_23]OGK44107.1 MAG: hypothetical protein A2956_03595 [Candidatus Roizmanbacteria bacterium RIFCSPLOWO2_01_FULL_37_57]OGK54386.1 MAG: hypothetical protein A3H80_02370 [Ca
MLIQRLSLGQLQANCYLLIEENKCLIIDPADEADFILEKIQRENLEPVALLATHGHFDHIMAAGEIQLSYNIPLYIHPDDLFLVKRLRETAKYFLGYEPVIVDPRNLVELKENFSISPPAGGFKFQIIPTPGHTPGSCCFYFKEENAIFTGDTLFHSAIGRYDFSYSNFNDLKTSLKQLFKLPKETIVYAGHGEETTISGEGFNFS